MQSFLDTSDPMQNLPAPIVAPTFQLVLEAMDRLLNNSASGVNVYALFVEALNHRLNTTCMDLPCVEAKLDSMGKDLGWGTAVPEVDGWLYDKVNVSLQCSECAANVWKHGFGDVFPSFQAGEQTPRDNCEWVPRGDERRAWRCGRCSVLCDESVRVSCC